MVFVAVMAALAVPTLRPFIALVGAVFFSILDNFHTSGS